MGWRSLGSVCRSDPTPPLIWRNATELYLTATLRCCPEPSGYPNGPGLSLQAPSHRRRPLLPDRCRLQRCRQGTAASRRGAVARVPRVPSPLIRPDKRISRIRLSDWFHRKHTTAVTGPLSGTKQDLLPPDHRLVGGVHPRPGYPSSDRSDRGGAVSFRIDASHRWATQAGRKGRPPRGRSPEGRTHGRDRARPRAAPGERLPKGGMVNSIPGGPMAWHSTSFMTGGRRSHECA